MELHTSRRFFKKQRPFLENMASSTGCRSFYRLDHGGGYSLYLQITKGHVVTGIRDNVV